MWCACVVRFFNAAALCGGKVEESGFKSDPIKPECEIFAFWNTILLADRIIYRETKSEEAGAALSPHLQNLLWRHNCKQLPQPPRDYLFVWNIWLSPQASTERLTNTSPLGEEMPKCYKEAQRPHHTQICHSSWCWHLPGPGGGYWNAPEPLQWRDACRCRTCLPMLHLSQKWSCLTHCCSRVGWGGLL